MALGVDRSEHPKRVSQPDAIRSFGRSDQCAIVVTTAIPEAITPIVEIEGEDSVLHMVFTIDKFTQIPGLRHLGYGDFGRLPPPRWRGIYDEQGRLLVAMNYDQDVGDSWEEADNPQYPEPMTALGYRFGINYIVYSRIGILNQNPAGFLFRIAFFPALEEEVSLEDQSVGNPTALASRTASRNERESSGGV